MLRHVAAGGAEVDADPGICGSTCACRAREEGQGRGVDSKVRSVEFEGFVVQNVCETAHDDACTPHRIRSVVSRVTGRCGRGEGGQKGVGPAMAHVERSEGKLRLCVAQKRVYLASTKARYARRTRNKT